MARILALLAACGLLLLSGPAAAMEVYGNTALSVARHPDLAALPMQAMLPAAPMSELPEPEVFAMMLLGLVLIGYRVCRDSSEKFK